MNLLPVYSWEKGTIENLVGSVRRFFPKKTGFSLVSDDQIRKVECCLTIAQENVYIMPHRMKS